ncbi:Flagellar M-ring protein (plasmid) [Rhodovastum atsumiense]|uniref:flagellar basal-body MS-ring/collar protein FliF n=1 Tax=Rhodovastum atsumiense TaxID=504468 RepID=UPI002024BE49|nr:flagellar basal-body MS-ring/collar protein FliF [Rhodovastum atsumiense]CAH2605532.1 Flagellar M-ring protein [Rhodovastum atsumiense]
MEQLATLRTALPRLGPGKLAALGGAALAVLLFVAWIATRPGEPKGLLYAGLDPAEAGRIAQRLEELKVPFEARADGTTLLVPVSQVPRVRMELAAAGLPHQSGAGYELLDAQSPMNMTSFMQHVQRLRALEGELARTIITMGGVKTARVHIVLPERESFAREAPNPTASVAVTMTGAARLTSSQAAAIRLVVGGAVPRLRQEDISVLDPSGVVLAADGGNAAAAGRLTEMKALQEQALQRAVMNLLEPLLGPGHVRAIASVELDGSRETQREEKFDPLSQVERSKQTQVDQETSEENRARDPVTVGQNLPNQQQGNGNATTKTAATRNGETINYEISSTLSERVREPGALKRLTVAVVVDGDVNTLPPAERDRLASLVRAAVGFDEKRGDQVSVETMRFAAGKAEGTEAGGTADTADQPSWLVIAAAVALFVLLAGGGGIAVAVRRRKNREMARRMAEQAALAAAAAPEEEMMLLSSLDQPIRASAVVALNELLDTRPDEALAVLRAWIAEEGGL